GRGGRPPARRRGRPAQRPAGTGEVPKEAQAARDLLREILERMGVTPVEIEFIAREEGEYFEVTGPDLAALIGRHGNTLEALNHVFNNIMNAGVRSNRRYYTIDAEGYRAHRADQLKSLALATLERCIREKQPQALEPMLPSERKIVHLALANSELVRTESEGEEPERRVVVHPV
ncbi:MAG TPA: R3H domain-containing nucleic acid-binding protein, partial [Candidatus Tyrphobacter sp.]